MLYMLYTSLNQDLFTIHENIFARKHFILCIIKIDYINWDDISAEYWHMKCIIFFSIIFFGNYYLIIVNDNDFILLFINEHI